ncbi:MAG: MFS transporter [Planctomycetes bacterium]|nr:MFS transporter [Planctomycetota bacterium]
MTDATSSPTVHNEKRLLWAGFFTLIAAGIGFSIRGGILGDWGAQFGFTQGELGKITGGGLTGFGITVLFFSLIADRVGYGALMAIAFLLHVSSAAVTLAATPAFAKLGKDAAYQCLYWGMFLFALGNGTCEAVINPLAATLYPREKTHWLNLLHAGWPGGLILGALLGLLFKAAGRVPWELQICTFLVPTLLYGALVFRQPFPPSEARAHGVTIGTMLRELASPMLFFLLLLHAMVGYVELGTDSWISNITGTILEDPQKGLLLFIWTSGLMFALRFFAGPIVRRISPLGLLFAGSLFGVLGLTLLGGATTGLLCVVAATIYGIGKTFYWPTMLGVVSERFPKGGALTLGAVGAIGAISGGLLGGPAIGYKQDLFASARLREASPEAFARYAAEEEKTFLPGVVPAIAGLDGAKVAALEDGGKQLAEDLRILRSSGRTDRNLEALDRWWESARRHQDADRGPVKGASLHGGRMALKWTALVPALMAAGYLLLILYFKARGGYRQVHLGGGPS